MSKYFVLHSSLYNTLVDKWGVSDKNTSTFHQSQLYANVSA